MATTAVTEVQMAEQVLAHLRAADGLPAHAGTYSLRTDLPRRYVARHRLPNNRPTKEMTS